MINANKARERSYNAIAETQGTLLNLIDIKIKEACGKGNFHVYVPLHYYSKEEIVEAVSILKRFGYECEQGPLLLEVWWYDERF